MKSFLSDSLWLLARVTRNILNEKIATLPRATQLRVSDLHCFPPHCEAIQFFNTFGSVFIRVVLHKTEPHVDNQFVSRNEATKRGESN